MTTLLILLLLHGTQTHSAAIPHLTSSVDIRNIHLDFIEHLFDSPLLEERLGCGHWQNHYARLHQNILKGLVPNKQLVMVAVESGLADQLAGILSAFYIALLSGRAIRFVSYAHLPEFSWAFDSPHIDWMVPRDEFADDILNPLKFSYKWDEGLVGMEGYRGDRNYSSLLIDIERFYPFYSINKQEQFYDLMVHSDLRYFPADEPNIEHVIMSVNRGFAHELFRLNDYHREQFKVMGFQQQRLTYNEYNDGSISTTSTGSHNLCMMCSFFFLFRPNQQVKDAYKDNWRELLADEHALTIGIHIRVRDKQIAPDLSSGLSEAQQGRLLLEEYEHYFTCAQEIEDTRLVSSEQTVKWFVMAAPLSLRKAIKIKFGDKVIVDTTTPGSHTNCKQREASGAAIHGLNNCDEKSRREAMVRAAGDMLTFSLAQYHVFSRYSGLSRLGAWLSNQPSHERNHMYTMERGEARKCGVDNYDAYELTALNI